MQKWQLLAVCALALALMGCGGGDSPQEKSPAEKTQDKKDAPKARNDHPENGPHGGKLIEFGGEAYHAELLVDKEAGQVTIYILGGNAKDLVPIEASEIQISEQSDVYTLKADPSEGDADGKSSRFVSEEKALAALLSGHVHARLLMRVGGKSYNGKIDSH